jgi:DNA-binding response OmpR family regulator
MQTRVLIVEDDESLARVVSDSLRFEGYQVAVSTDGNEAIAQSRAFQPDIVLLDVMLPGRSGFDVCSVLRRGGRVPIIIMSARSQKADKVRGLQLGADDYLAKPFDFEELLARMQAVLRRSRRSVDRLILGTATIDLGAMKATSGGRDLHFTFREFEVLRYLAERQDQVVYRDELLREIWGYVDVPLSTTRSVDHAIVRLRKKIEPDPRRPTYIRTVHGDGYSLCVDGPRHAGES